MAYTKYSLTPANNTATPPDGAPEGMLPSAVNDTMRDMMAQIRDCGDGIRDGTYTMTAPKITGGTITGSTINNSAIGGTTAAAGKFTTLEATGVTTVQAGTVSAPAITTTGDTNTGIFFPAADTIAFTEGGVESMRIDSSGNVGIGTSSPTSFGGGYKTLEVKGSTSGNGGVFRAATSDNSYIFDMYANNAGGSLETRGAYPIAFTTNGSERMRIDSSGNVGIGTSSPNNLLEVSKSQNAETQIRIYNANAGSSARSVLLFGSDANAGAAGIYLNSSTNTGMAGTYSFNIYQGLGAPIAFHTNGTERMRISSGGNLLVATTSSDVADANGTGASFSAAGNAQFSRASGGVMNVNRKTDDGVLVYFQQDASAEGNISVSGTTVSYNGGHLSRWSQLPNNQKDNTLLKGTVMSNLDDMCVWTKDGEVLPNEQLNKMKVSDIDGDTNVAGVFVSWEFDEQCQSDDMNVAMTGDMIIRIAEGVVVQKGDLLMSAGDGTAKPQGDDIRKSKTIAKVTSNHVTCTYADGSYCVPCVLMAC